MRLIHNTVFAVAYWVVAVISTVVAAVVGGKAGSGAAPEFGDGSGTSVGSQVLFGAGGALVAGLAVAALFAGVWMALWAADRRSHPGEGEDAEGFDTLDDLDDDFDDAERRHLDGHADDDREHAVFDQFQRDEAPARR